MRKFLSVLATAILVLQSMGTSLVYAQAANEGNEGGESTPAVDTVVEESTPETESADEAPANEEPAIEETVAEPEISEESAPAEELADETEDLDEEPAAETPTEEENAEEPADVVEPVEEPEVPAVVQEPKAEESASVEEEKVEEKSALATVVDTVFSNPLNGYVDGIYVTVEDPLGGLPAGVRMELAPVLEEHVFDLIDSSLDAKVTKVVAVDITFYDANNEKVEPEEGKPINVKMVAGDMPEAQSVVHVEADYNEEKIEVGEANVEEIVADIDGNTAEFEAESFSIYAIVAAEDPRLLVNFYNGANLITGVYVKQGDDLSKLIFDPGVGTVGEDEVFKGWTTDSDYNTGTASLTIEGVRTEVETELNKEERESKINFYAMMFDRYIVKYLNEGDGVVHTDEIVLKCETEPCEILYTLDWEYVAQNPESNFMGWIFGGSTVKNGQPIKISRSESLKPDVQKGHWLVFNENGKGATYNAPQFVMNGQVTTSGDLLPMVRNGYTFGGWYKDEACTEEFTFGEELTNRTEIYAKWIAAKMANYTVIIWKQNLAGDGYDFVESVAKSASVGSTPNAVNASNGRVSGAGYNGEAGFSFKSTDQASKTVATEGNTVVNVYYDRNEYTLTFQDHPYTATTDNNGTQYGLVDGEYIQLTRHNQGSTFNPNYYWTYGNNTRYNGTRYTQGSTWVTVNTITALYQQPIEDKFPIEGSNGALYNHGERWDPQSTNGNLDVIVFLDIMPAKNETYHIDKADFDTKTMNYYVEALPGDENVSTFNGKSFTLYNTINANLNYVDKNIDWVDLNGFTKYGSNPEFPSNNRLFYGEKGTVNFYYTRNEYTINFMDGAYVDGNNNPITTESSQGQISIKTGIAYGADISSNNNYQPESPIGYVFEGWFIDDKGNSKYTFTTMPEGGLTVYAKWRQIQYRVFLHPGDVSEENDSGLSWGSDSQDMNFRVSYGGKISVPTGIRPGYEFIGWFMDDGRVFNKDAYVLNETNVKTAYVKDAEENWTDGLDGSKMTKYGTINGDGYNSDLYVLTGGTLTLRDRFWITKKFDLYAEWSKILLGASGVNLVYDVNGGQGTPVDNALYTDNSEVSVLSAPTAPTGKQFAYWVAQKYEKESGNFVDTSTTVYPGGKFKVNADWAKDVDNGDDTHTYTIQLRAEYVDIESPDPTKIRYCDGEFSETDCKGFELGINEEHKVKSNEEVGLTRDEAYKFIGWEDKGGNPYKVGSGVGANNNNYPEGNVLIAQWDCNDNYHSEDDGNSCVSNEGFALCKIGTDENANYAEENVPVEWDVTLNDGKGGWTEAAPCSYTCKEGTHLENGEGTACVEEKSLPCEPGTDNNANYTQEDKPAVWNGNTNSWEAVACSYTCKEGTHLENGEGTACVSNTGAEAKCTAELPANAEAVIDTYTPTWTEKGWSTEPAWALKGDECTYKCKDGYHVNGNKCEKDSNPGNGSGGGRTPDYCPDGDKSGDRYDGTCDAPGGGGDDEEIELGGQVSDKCSVEGSDRSPEEIAAYLYACENDITTIRDINEARLGDYLNRAEMAKIISVFATKELGMKPNTSKDCSNFAESMEGWSQEMKDFMVMSCQLELMGIHTVNYEAIPDFMPAKRVSRAEFGTILSRVLWGNKYEGTNENYYFRHLDALKANNIITNIDPNITEYRAWVLLMVYRAVEVIKSGNATPKTSVEEQVNEELQEEAKAETGTVASVETGSVAEVETGSTAEVETGAVAEVETGAVVEVETGAVAEVETGSTTD